MSPTRTGHGEGAGIVEEVLVRAAFWGAGGAGGERLGLSEWRVLDVVLCFSRGLGRGWAFLPRAELAGLVGVSGKRCLAVVNALVARGLIERQGELFRVLSAQSVLSAEGGGLRSCPDGASEVGARVRRLVALNLAGPGDGEGWFRGLDAQVREGQSIIVEEEGARGEGREGAEDFGISLGSSIGAARSPDSASRGVATICGARREDSGAVEQRVSNSWVDGSNPSQGSSLSCGGVSTELAAREEASTARRSVLDLTAAMREAVFDPDRFVEPEQAVVRGEGRGASWKVEPIGAGLERGGAGSGFLARVGSGPLVTRVVSELSREGAGRAGCIDVGKVISPDRTGRVGAGGGTACVRGGVNAFLAELESVMGAELGRFGKDWRRAFGEDAEACWRAWSSFCGARKKAEAAGSKIWNPGGWLWKRFNALKSCPDGARKEAVA